MGMAASSYGEKYRTRYLTEGKGWDAEKGVEGGGGGEMEGWRWRGR
jgi:hypothetical protein